MNGDESSSMYHTSEQGEYYPDQSGTYWNLEFIIGSCVLSCESYSSGWSEGRYDLLVDVNAVDGNQARGWIERFQRCEVKSSTPFSSEHITLYQKKAKIFTFLVVFGSILYAFMGSILLLSGMLPIPGLLLFVLMLALWLFGLAAYGRTSAPRRIRAREVLEGKVVHLESPRWMDFPDGTGHFIFAAHPDETTLGEHVRVVLDDKLETGLNLLPCIQCRSVKAGYY
jgi:hypothetical protein